MSIVLRFSVELPPAPYVTDTNVGFRRDSSASARPRFRSPSSVLGGKNSKENDGSAPPASRSSIRIAGSLGSRRPPLGGLTPAFDQPLPLEMDQVGASLGQQPRGRGLVEELAVDRLGDLVRGPRQGGADGLEPFGDERAVRGDVARNVGERAAVARQREPAVEALDLVARG